MVVEGGGSRWWIRWVSGQVLQAGNTAIHLDPPDPDSAILSIHKLRLDDDPSVALSFIISLDTCSSANENLSFPVPRYSAVPSVKVGNPDTVSRRRHPSKTSSLDHISRSIVPRQHLRHPPASPVGTGDVVTTLPDASVITKYSRDLPEGPPRLRERPIRC